MPASLLNLALRGCGHRTMHASVLATFNYFTRNLTVKHHVTTYRLVPFTFPRPRFSRISGEFFLVHSNQPVLIDADFHLFVTVVTKSSSRDVCDLYSNLLQGVHVNLCCALSHRSPRRVFTTEKLGNEVE